MSKKFVDGVRDDEASLHFQIRMFKTAGMWPLDEESSKAKKIIYSLYISFTMFSLISTSVLSTIALANLKNLTELASTVDILTMMASAACKMALTKKNKEEMNAILKEIRSFTRRPILGGENDQQSFFDYTKYTKLLTVIHPSIGAFTICVWLLSPIVEKTNYAVMIWTPTGTEQSSYYPLVYFISGWSLLLAAHIYLTSDCYFFTLLYICCYHIDQLSYAYKAIDKLPTIKESERNSKLEGLKKCAEHHGKILRLIEKVEFNWRTLFLVDLLHSVISLSFGLLHSSMSSSILSQVKTYFFIGYSYFHQFLNAYFGEMLVNYESKVFHWLYEMDWVSMNPQERRLVLFMMTRSKKVVRINAWHLYDFSYPKFMELSKALMSYYMVLKTLETDETS